MNENAKDAALRYLGPRDHTTKEVASHLKEKGFSAEDIEPVIAFLKDCRYVDDEDFAQRFVIMSIEKGRGPGRIRHDLEEKGIPSSLIRILLEEHYEADHEKELALDLGRKKAGENPEEKDLARAGRFLATRGFGNSTIYYVLGVLRKEARMEDE